MVDEGRLIRLLRTLSDRVERLELAGSTASDDRSPLWLDGVKYDFRAFVQQVSSWLSGQNNVEATPPEDRR